jgi:hypothetical protein
MHISFSYNGHSYYASSCHNLIDVSLADFDNFDCFYIEIEDFNDDVYFQEHVKVFESDIVALIAAYREANNDCSAYEIVGVNVADGNNRRDYAGLVGVVLRATQAS